MDSRPLGRQTGLVSHRHLPWLPGAGGEARPPPVPRHQSLAVLRGRPGCFGHLQVPSWCGLSQICTPLSTAFSSGGCITGFTLGRVQKLLMNSEGVMIFCVIFHSRNHPGSVLSISQPPLVEGFQSPTRGAGIAGRALR